MKILILGYGFIGQKLWGPLDAFVSCQRITTGDHVLELIDFIKPDVIINCIGKTGHPNIDWCEDNKAATLFSNLTVPLLIAEACQQRNVKMVQMGTGCIYEGGIFWEEDDPNFVRSYYSKTKYLAEQALQDFNVLQLRVRMPIDSIPSPRNLVCKLFSYDKVINVRNSVTVLDDLVYATDRLIHCNAQGIFNVVNPEAVTHEEIIRIFEPALGKFKGRFIREEELMTKAGRSNCVLSCSKLVQYGIHLRPTRKALQQCASNFKPGGF